MSNFGDHKPRIALTWLKKFVFVMSLLLHCDVIKTPSVQSWFVYFFVSVQPLSTNFAPPIVLYTISCRRPVVILLGEKKEDFQSNLFLVILSLETHLCQGPFALDVGAEQWPRMTGDQTKHLSSLGD